MLPSAGGPPLCWVLCNCQPQSTRTTCLTCRAPHGRTLLVGASPPYTAFFTSCFVAALATFFTFAAQLCLLSQVYAASACTRPCPV